MEVQNQRDCFFDISRGIAIILMVFAHIIPSKFIYLFHMPFFIVLSGFFFKEKYYETFSNLVNFIISKFKRLMIPFIAYTIIFELLHNFFINIHFYEVNSKIQYYNNIYDILRNTIFHIEPLIGSIWFLFALFFISILFSLISYTLKIFKMANEIYRLIVILLFLQIGFYISFQPWNKFLYIGTICSSLTSFYIGYLFNKFYNKRNFFNTRNFILSFLVLLFFNIITQNPIAIAANTYYNPGFLILLSIIGFIFINSFVIFIKQNYIQKILSYIGKNTLPILCLHSLSFKVVTYAIIIFMNKDISILLKLAYVPDKNIFLIMIYLFVGIFLPILANYLTNRITNHIKNIQRIKNESFNN